MRDAKFFTAAGIFLALTLFKILLPGVVYDMRDEIVTQIDKNIDYTAVVAALSQRIDKYSDQFDFLVPSAEPEASPSPDAEPSAAPEPEDTSAAAAAETADVTTLSPTPVPSTTPTPAQTAEASSAVSPAAEGTLPFEYRLPLSVVSVSSGFGERMHPIEGVEKFHYGVDLAANEGDPICAFADGTVVTAELSDSYGNYIVLRHDETYATLYAHCSKLLVEPGDKVTIGQEIALVGQTGEATGPHLHFELRKNGEPIDPEAYLC